MWVMLLLSVWLPPLLLAYLAHSRCVAVAGFFQGLADSGAAAATFVEPLSTPAADEVRQVGEAAAGSRSFKQLRKFYLR